MGLLYSARPRCQRDGSVIFPRCFREKVVQGRDAQPVARARQLRYNGDCAWCHNGVAAQAVERGGSARRMAEYITTIGLEVHAQLLTASKMFCGCAAEGHGVAGAAPNTLTCP